MDLISHFNTFIDYPGATVAHWLICILAGMMIVSQRIGCKIFGCLLIFWWITYEMAEMIRINDKGDIDIANGLFAFIISVFISGCVRVYLDNKS